MIYNGGIYNANWNTKKLNELGSFSRGISKHRPRNDKNLFKNGKYPLIQTGEIKESPLYVKEHNQAYNEFGLKQSKLWNAGTLCITIAANIAETAILGYPMCFPDSVVGFNAYPNQSSEIFMHYIFTYIRNSIQNSASGSIQDNINIDYLTELEFKIPDKEYQDQIVKVLLSLDKKIENNNKIISQLESLAKTIYDYWFLQFDFPDENGKPYKSSGGKMVWNAELKREIPEGWEVSTIGSCIEKVSTGLNPRNNFILGNGNIRYITVKNIAVNGNLDFSNCDTIDEAARIIVHNRSDISMGDILFASIAPLGRCFLITQKPETWDINESVFSIRVNKEIVSPEFLYQYFISQEFIKMATSSSTGSIFKGIRINTLLDSIKLIPAKLVVDKFTEAVHQIIFLKNHLNEENVELTKLRDWLLPMLMNGQVKVK